MSQQQIEALPTVLYSRIALHNLRIGTATFYMYWPYGDVGDLVADVALDTPAQIPTAADWRPDAIPPRRPQTPEREGVSESRCKWPDTPGV